MNENKTCFSCGANDAYELVTREPERVIRHGIAFEVTGMKWFECKVCHEVMSTPAIVNENALLIDRAYAARRAEHRIEKNLLDPATIKSIRIALGESQENLSELLGVGANGLQKYESDKSCPSKPAELILRVLARYPTFLSTLRKIALEPASSFGEVNSAAWNHNVCALTQTTFALSWNTPSRGRITAGAICGETFLLMRDAVYPAFILYAAGSGAAAIFHGSSDTEVKGAMSVARNESGRDQMYRDFYSFGSDQSNGALEHAKH